MSEIVLGINPLMRMGNFNPFDYYSGNSPSQLSLILDDYFETVQPFVEVVDVIPKSKGFARYEMEIWIENHRNGVGMNTSTVWCEVNRGKYTNWKDPDGCTRKILLNDPNVDYFIEKMKELPDSAHIYLSLTTSTPKEIEALKNEEIVLEWIRVYQPNVDFEGGLSIQKYSMEGDPDYRESYSEKRIFRDEMTEEQLLGVYISNLENLMNHYEVWKSLELVDENTIYYDKMAVLKETYEDAKMLKTLQTKSFCISGGRDEIVNYLEKTDVTGLLVYEIKLV